MIKFSLIYSILMAIALGIIIYNIRIRKLPKKIFLISLVPLIFIFIFLYIQTNMGSSSINGFFEKIGTYETKYYISVYDPNSSFNGQKNATASLQRPKNNCSILTAAYFPKKCKRETTLQTIYSPKDIIKPIRDLEFAPNYCSINNFNTLNICIDDHSRTWNVILTDEKIK